MTAGTAISDWSGLYLAVVRDDKGKIIAMRHGFLSEDSAMRAAQGLVAQLKEEDEDAA